MVVVGVSVCVRVRGRDRKIDRERIQRYTHTERKKRKKKREEREREGDTHLVGKLRHLRQSASVVANGAVRIDSETRGQVSEHAYGSQSHAVQVAALEGCVDDGGEDKHRHDGGLVA